MQGLELTAIFCQGQFPSTESLTHKLYEHYVIALSNLC